MDLKEIRKTLAEASQLQKETWKAIGELSNKFGSFTAALAAPSVRKVLQDEFGAEKAFEHLAVQSKGRSQEFDLLGIGKDEVVLTEVKSKLTEGELKKFEKKYEDFFDFMPEYKGRQLHGLLVAVDMPESMPERVARRGFYLMMTDDGNFSLRPTHKSFKPRTTRG